MKKVSAMVLTLLLTSNIFGQTESDKERAYEIAKKAIKVMDEGKIDESIKMLEQSQSLDPKNYLYPYEIGYAYFLKENHKKAIKTLKGVIKIEENNDQCFTLLGNIYDIVGQPAKAIEIYRKGLEKFPGSGRLYFELGNVQEVLKDNDNALSSWEQGILVSPSYPSNYHTASIYFCKYTTEKIWGIIYGEMFMNIERGSEKTVEISKLLFDTYLSSITFKSKKEVGVSFSKMMQMSLPSNGEDIKLPFSMQFEMAMALAIAPEKKTRLDIASLHDIRTTFINHWYENKKDLDYPNILFDWHKEMIELGHFEAYNHWLLMKGNEDEFDKWLEGNKEKFDRFIEWFSGNPLKVDAENCFHRSQYK